MTKAINHAQQVTCPKGHTYLKVDIRHWPAGAPECPVCFGEWIEVQKIINSNLTSDESSIK